MTMQKLALIRLEPEAIISTFPATARRIDIPAAEGKVVLSPPQAGWEGFGFRIADVVPADPVPEGKQETGRTVELVDGVPVEVLTLEDAPPEPRRRVEKWLIIERVNAAGKAAAADALLNMPGNEFAKFRWLAPVESVFFDDADTVAMIVALGLDPDEILAP